MFPYIIDVALTAWISSSIVDRYNYNGIAQYQNRRKKIMLLVLILFIWVLFFAFRGTTSGDISGYRGNYKAIFLENKSLEQCLEKNRDKLYQILIYFCSMVFHGNWLPYAIIAGFLMYVPIFFVIAKKSEDINLSCLVFLLSLNAFYGFNGLRQGLSLGFALCAYYLGLRQKKFFRYILLMLIAYGFHAAILIVFPFHLLSLKKLKSFSTFILLFLLFGASIFLESFWGDFASLFSDGLVSRYSSMNMDTNGSSIIRVVVSIAPVILCLFYYRSIKEKFPDIDHDILMIVFGTLFMLYSMRSVSFSQMAIYFSATIIIILPKVVRSIDVKEKRIIKGIVITLYFLYMIIMLWHGDMGLNPYIPIWEAGTY